MAKNALKCYGKLNKFLFANTNKQLDELHALDGLCVHFKSIHSDASAKSDAIYGMEVNRVAFKCSFAVFRLALQHSLHCTDFRFLGMVISSEYIV